MILSIGWGFGQIFIALFVMGINYWRIIFFITAVPLTILIWFLIKYLEESPRFLVVKHRFEDAKNVIKNITLLNG